MGASNAENSAVPDLLGVPEAAALLRVGLTFADESTARFIATGSADEIPAITRASKCAPLTEPPVRIVTVMRPRNEIYDTL